MNSASAYKNVKRRMAMMAEKGKKKPVAMEEESSGLLKRKPTSDKPVDKEDMNEVIASYIEAVRGLES